MNSWSVGDRYEGVLLETVQDLNVSRPRVKPLEYFESDIRVEFPRYLRDENPIGTRFRADVKVSQKTKNNQPYGKPYLVATDKSIFKLSDFSPSKAVIPIKLNTISDRAYKYLEDEFEKDTSSITFDEFRANAYKQGTENPMATISKSTGVNRKEIIKSYALLRSDGKCECCGKDAPFLKKNGEPYLEVHHMEELGKGGADSPLNVSAVCPTCHRRISHGIDGNDLNFQLIEKIKRLEEAMGTP